VVSQTATQFVRAGMLTSGQRDKIIEAANQANLA
jgi:hypothetical protein